MDYFVGSRVAMDIEMEEELVKRVGGRFALTSLLQKRIVELNRGAPQLVATEPGERNWKRIAYREILEGKIALSTSEEAEYPKADETPRIQDEDDGKALSEESPEIYGSDIKKIKEQRIKELAQLLNPKKP